MKKEVTFLDTPIFEMSFQNLQVEENKRSNVGCKILFYD